VGGFESWSAHFGDTANLLPRPAIETRFLGCPTRNSVANLAKTYPMTDELTARVPKMTRGNITLARGIYFCPNFFLFPDQHLYIVKNVYKYT
jgi:hypothetical protein